MDKIELFNIRHFLVQIQPMLPIPSSHMNATIIKRQSSWENLETNSWKPPQYHRCYFHHWQQSSDITNSPSVAQTFLKYTVEPKLCNHFALGFGISRIIPGVISITSGIYALRRHY